MSDLPPEIAEMPLTATEPTETPAPTAESRTDLDMLKEIFEQYSTSDEARKHVNEVAKGKNRFNKTFSKPNCYKAINKKCQFSGEKGKIESHEATAKLGEGEDIEIIPETETSQQQPPELTNNPYATESTATYPTGTYDAVKAELRPIQERAVKGIVNNVFEIVGLKGGKGDPLISDQESTDTITLLPYILKKVTKKDLDQEGFENLSIALHLANIASKAVNRRMQNKPKDKSLGIQTEPPKQAPTETPAPQPVAETPKTEIEVPPDERNKQFLTTLGKMER